MAKPNAIDRYKEIMEVYFSRDPDTLEKFKSYLGNSFTGFGTALHEYQDSPEEIVAQLKKEILLAPHISALRINWIKEQKVSDRISIVNAKLGVKFKLEGKEVEIDPIRASVIFELRDGDYFPLHWYS